MKIKTVWVLAVAALGSAACNRPAPEAAAAGAVASPASHEHVAPHGGQLIELGSEFAQVECVLDAQAGTLTAYVLDGEAEESVRVKQPSLTLVVERPSSLPEMVLAAHVNILTGETVGDSSEFSVENAELKGVRGIDGRLLDVVVKGQEFRDTSFRCSPVIR